jgi:hypothetical protein
MWGENEGDGFVGDFVQFLGIGRKEGGGGGGLKTNYSLTRRSAYRMYKWSIAQSIMLLNNIFCLFIVLFGRCKETFSNKAQPRPMLQISI